MLNYPELLLIIYFIFKHILLAQNRPESDADGERSDRIAFRNPFPSSFKLENT